MLGAWGGEYGFSIGKVNELVPAIMEMDMKALFYMQKNKLNIGCAGH